MHPLSQPKSRREPVVSWLVIGTMSWICPNIRAISQFIHLFLVRKLFAKPANSVWLHAKHQTCLYYSEQPSETQ